MQRGNADDTGAAVVRVEPSGHEVAVRPGESLLAAALRQTLPVTDALSW